MTITSDSDQENGRRHSLLLEAISVATPVETDSQSKTMTSCLNHPTSTTTNTQGLSSIISRPMSQETCASDVTTIQYLSNCLESSLEATLAIASQLTYNSNGLSPRLLSIIKELSNLDSNPLILQASTEASQPKGALKPSDVLHLYLPPKFPRQWHIS